MTQMNRPDFFLKKKDHSFCCIQEIVLNIKDRQSKRLRRYSKQIDPREQANVANKIDFKPKLIQRDRDK